MRIVTDEPLAVNLDGEVAATTPAEFTVERNALRGQIGLPSPVAYYVAHETLQALAYAHSKRDRAGAPLGIVHRDVAAGNVILSFNGEVKLSDFGIVKSNDRVSRTQVGLVKGNAPAGQPSAA